MIRRVLLALIAAAAPCVACAGKLVDPRQLEKPVFPKAEVTLVTFEFEAVAGDERGKRRAVELHNEFLHRIHDLHGGAIVTAVSPKGQRIENYRITASDAARKQNAQMVLWGRVLLDRGGRPLIVARLELVVPPPGIRADYETSTTVRGEPLAARGTIDAPVTQTRVDFQTMENDVAPLAAFLAGLARYYKGAARQGAEAARWLQGSIADFGGYVAQVREGADDSALAQAHLYLARAHARLASADPARSAAALRKAGEHADAAARLNPFDASVPTAQAVIAARRKAPPREIRPFLQRAVSLAPTDTNARVNLAMMNTAQGDASGALKQIESTSVIQKAKDKPESAVVRDLRRQIETIQGTGR